MAFQHFRDALHLAPELVEHVAAFMVKCDLDKHQQGSANMLRVDAREISGDYLVALHAFYALDTRRDGEPDLLGEILHRDTSVLLKNLQDTVIELVQRSY